jgi:hypothetical protein
MEQAHGMGHEGIQKTFNRLRASFFTPHNNNVDALFASATK